MYEPGGALGMGVRPPYCPAPEKLAHADFWPACLHAEDGFTNVHFERFDTLLPRANAWLRERPRITVLKCETTERRICCAEQLANSNPKFDVPSADKNVYIINGLRLWYTSEIGLDATLSSHAAQIGYRTYVPRCIDTSVKHLAYEDLTELFADINEVIIEKPLEGKIITVETVPLRLIRPQWEGPDIASEQTHWLESPKYHILYITRVFYLFQCPSYEQIGAADFLPDFLNDDNPRTSVNPRYTDFYSIVVKVNQWLEKVKEVRLANIQCLETSFPGVAHADMLNTSENFIAKADTQPLIKFLRVTYVRPKYGLPPGGLTVPRLITYKTFIPAVVGGGGSTCSGSSDTGASSGPEFEPLVVLWSRVKTWLQQSERRVVGMEVVHHPLPLVVRRRDEGETTVMKGLWVFSSAASSNSSDVMQRVPTVELIRIYFDGQMNTMTSLPASSLPSVAAPSPLPPPTPPPPHNGSRASSNSPILRNTNKPANPKPVCNLL